MRNILIVLLLTAALGAAGFMLTAELSRQSQNASAEREGDTGLSRAAGDLSKRQTYAMIGGGVGAGVGLIAGFLIANRLDRRNRRPGA